jgi:hypothetical protein
MNGVEDQCGGLRVGVTVVQRFTGAALKVQGSRIIFSGFSV